MKRRFRCLATALVLNGSKQPNNKSPNVQHGGAKVLLASDGFCAIGQRDLNRPLPKSPGPRTLRLFS
jgi:hypothetical protein